MDSSPPILEDQAMENDKQPPATITPLQRKITNAAMTIADMDDEHPEFLHAVLCQLGLPRSKQGDRKFTRSAGRSSLMISAGERYDGMQWHELPLPYGTRPRLVLTHLCGEAIRTNSRVVDVSEGIVPFLRRVGIPIGGGQFKGFKNQMTYLAACTMSFGWLANGKVQQAQATPIHRFEAWADPFNGQCGLWPDTIELGADFYDTLRQHAVPLSPTAIGALQHSALALDIYTWLAHRLLRIRNHGGVRLSWGNLKDQFGQEYGISKDFKKDFKPALRKALAVYPDAKVTSEIGGIRLHCSPPPITQTKILGFSQKDV